MSKSTLRYTLIGEGFAEYEFIPAYMTWLGKTKTPQLQVNRTNVQIPISKNPSVSKVLQEAGNMCARSFTDNRDPCDLCIIGIDLDKPDHTDDLEYHTERLRELQDSMGKVHHVYKDNIILYVPIQAIDCWINYVQHNATPDSLESAIKNEIKKRVYGQSNPDRQRIKKVVQEAVMKADFAKLAKQSRSFGHFHKQVTEFLTTFIHQTT